MDTYGGSGEGTQEPPGIAALILSVTRARQHYQACRYSDLITRLPSLLAHLDAACAALDGDDTLRAAEQTAPQELAARAPVRTLARNLAALAPPGTRREAAHLADRIGAYT